MEFEMNGRKWTIKEVPQSIFWKDDDALDQMNNNECYFGRTKFRLQEIWIDKDLPRDLKKKTLYHELLHCYIGCYLCFYDIDGRSEDFWCEISANSHDIIHKIVEEFYASTPIEI